MVKTTNLNLPEGKSPLNPIKPPFSCGFPMVFVHQVLAGLSLGEYAALAAAGQGPRDREGSGHKMRTPPRKVLSFSIYIYIYI